MDSNLMITNIQRFSLHDGPGIRTTVFLKGCSLNCPWCLNPENISFDNDSFTEKGNSKKFGYYISLEELKRYILRDKNFYEVSGGVTFSGGEALLFSSKIEPLLLELKREKINIFAETSLFVPSDEFNVALKYLDGLIIDCKILNKEKCYSVCKGNIELFLNNMDRLKKEKKEIIFRIPLIKPYTTNEDNLRAIAELIKGYEYQKIELIRGHNLATEKYKKLNKEQYIVPELNESDIENILECFYKKNLCPIVCSI